MNERVDGVLLRVRGTVQGVGFRPHLTRLARRLGVAGFCRNDSAGVLVGVEARAAERFVEALRSGLPRLARADVVEPIGACAIDPRGFFVTESELGPVDTQIAPDADTCAECLAEIRDPSSRRFRYPFTNCTHCGPRFSIVRGVPFDRERTSMAPFAMCVDCAREFSDPEDRRFHAQAIACPACGPRVWIDGDERCDPIARAAALLLEGRIVAMRGIGGFQLLCDATNEQVVDRLRERKARDAKPFALMARDLDVVRAHASLSEDEANALASPAAPIVLVARRDPHDARPVTARVAPGMRRLGFMLPTSPLHHLLLEAIDRPVVCTSGNRSDEPPCTDNDDARARLESIADALLLHDREIVTRVDDSLVREVHGAVRVVRRARGFAPAPIASPPGFDGCAPVLACGAHLKSTACLLTERGAVMSQHLGDQDEALAFEAWEASVAQLIALYELEPSAIAVDLHPEYRPTRAGEAMARDRALALVRVQHHHAHVAACLFENAYPRDGAKVLGVAFDGLGMGVSESGAPELWGGEFLISDYANFERIARLRPAPLLGGDQAARQPWRSLYAHLHEAIDVASLTRDFGGLAIGRRLLDHPIARLDHMIAKGLNAPLTSSCGRLFDAVAAACELSFDAVAFEGQAAMELEASIDREDLERAKAGDRYTLELTSKSGLSEIDPRAMWRAIFEDRVARVPVGRIAAKFHAALADAIVRVANDQRSTRGVTTVALTGGVFQNAVLTELTARGLEREGFVVLLHRHAPANDGGISLGQAAVCAARSLASSESSHV